MHILYFDVAVANLYYSNTTTSKRKSTNEPGYWLIILPTPPSHKPVFPILRRKESKSRENYIQGLLWQVSL